MGHNHPYHYTPICDLADCDHPASYKVAAPWSDGTQHELKNYGVYCREHAQHALEAARRRRTEVSVGPCETLGPVRLFELIEGRRDAELTPVA